jgi:D-alanyl-D-alanine carboxypeptidase
VFGTQAFGGGRPARLDDHVRIGSITKTWTGTVILQLADTGALSLDDAVSRYRPEVPNAANITIAQLLDMRSGLFNYSEALEFNESLDRNPARVWTNEELLAIAFKNPPYFPPGRGWHYSNTNTILLGQIIEIVTGRPVELELTARIFAPFGLTDTRFPARTVNTLPKPFPQGSMFGTNVETMATEALSPERQAAARSGALRPTDMTFASPSWTWTAGAGISTLDDLARYAQALVGGGLLSEAMQARRLASVRPVDPSKPDVAYGWALARFGEHVYGHTGELPGYNSFLGHDPRRGITIITWSSLNAGPDGRAPAVEMAKAIVGQLYGAPAR